MFLLKHRRAFWLDLSWIDPQIGKTRQSNYISMSSTTLAKTNNSTETTGAWHACTGRSQRRTLPETRRTGCCKPTHTQPPITYSLFQEATAQTASRADLSWGSISGKPQKSRRCTALVATVFFLSWHCFSRRHVACCPHGPCVCVAFVVGAIAVVLALGATLNANECGGR